MVLSKVHLYFQEHQLLIAVCKDMFLFFLLKRGRMMDTIGVIGDVDKKTRTVKVSSSK